MQEPLLRVKDLCVTYPGCEPCVADVSFELYGGRILGLVGESGSGKSTVCRAILGLLSGAAVQGQVWFQDRDLLALASKQLRPIRGKGIALVMQNPMTAFDPVMKIKGHFIETITAHRSCGAEEAYGLGLSMVKKVGLKPARDIMESYPGTLSGGMLQRVMIALAVVLKPAVLIADEPTTSLDAQSQSGILAVLEKIRDENAPAMLLVSHDMGVISQMADDVAVIQNGRIVEYGPADRIFLRPRHAYTKELLDARLLITEG